MLQPGEYSLSSNEDTKAIPAGQFSLASDASDDYGGLECDWTVEEEIKAKRK